MSNEQTMKNDAAYREMMEGMLWSHFLLESHADDPHFPKWIPLSEWGDTEHDWSDVVAAAREAQAKGLIEGEDVLDGCRLTPDGLRAATEMFPNARAKWEALRR